MGKTLIPLVKTCVITGFGINADDELQLAFQTAGSRAEKLHINDLISAPYTLHEYHILAFPGGFSYGDHLGSGKVFAGLFKRNLKEALDGFLASGKLVIGICNGFQVLVKMGILPNLSQSWKPEVSLINNDSGKFEDRWVRLSFDHGSPCVWTKGLDEMELPVRHGEGKFVIATDEVLDSIVERGLIAVRYVSRSGPVPSAAEDVPYPDNPNGSLLNIAGICDASGRIFGLMPHPEAFVQIENHPRWTREKVTRGRGLEIFERGVRYMEKQLHT